MTRHGSEPEDEAFARAVAAQESCFARAFAAKNLELARHLYCPDVLYLSPTVRLFDWPPRIEGIEKTLEFIALTIAGCEEIEYRAVESAIDTVGALAFVHIHFDWTRERRRLRSRYLVLYRYRAGRIAQQEVFYDPSGTLEQIDA